MIWSPGAIPRGAIALAAAGALALGTAGPASADIYFANALASTIAHAPLDGTDASVLISSAGDNLGLMTAANAKLYWTSYAANAIGRSSIDGTQAEANWITGAAEVSGVAVDASHVYWTEDGNGRVSRAAIDGTEIEPDFITGLSSPHGLAIDGDQLYIANTAADQILRAPLAGGPAEPFITGVTGPQSIATNGAHLYWTGFRGENVGRANLDGSGVKEDFIDLHVESEMNWTYGVAVDADHVYWSNYTGQSIGRSALDGSDVQTSFVSAANWPTGLAVVAHAPVIGSVTPSSGTVSGGTSLTLAGTGFFPSARVRVGGAACSGVSVQSSTQLTCQTPAGQAGSADVTVTNPDNQFVTAPAAYTYVAEPPAPPSPGKPCAAWTGPPAKIAANAKTYLLAPHCTTSTGKPMTVAVQGRLQSRGDLSYYRVKIGRGGAVKLRTYGHPLRLKVTWSAPAPAGPDGGAFSLVRHYRT